MAKNSTKKQEQETKVAANSNTTTKEEKNMSKEVTVNEHKEAARKEAAGKGQPTKSEIIRSMYEEGIAVADIAKQLDAHYSFVYGVVKNHLGGEKPESKKEPTKSDKIREMYDQGMTPGDIAKELNANYSFVHTVCKKHREGGNK